jgi:hypothetical protein
VITALAREVRGLDWETRSALGQALERGSAELTGGAWGSREDGEGCLLSLAAWEMGLASGDELLHRSISAVRVPALFDELWALVVRRTGDAEYARQVCFRLVRAALQADQADGVPPVSIGVAPISSTRLPVAALSARPR